MPHKPLEKGKREHGFAVQRFLLILCLFTGMSIGLFLGSALSQSAGSVISANDINSLRNRINAKRNKCHAATPSGKIGPYPWSQQPLQAGQVIRAAHFLELRTAINEINTRGQVRRPVTWTYTGGLAAGQPIRDDHRDELENALTASSCCGDGRTDFGTLERCDDENDNNNDSCNNACQKVNPPCRNFYCHPATDCNCPGYGDCPASRCTDPDPCADSDCDLSVDCDCSDGHGDCTVAECTDECNDNVCDTAVDCFCSDNQGDCTSGQCITCDNDGVCESGETCANCSNDCCIFCNNDATCNNSENCQTCPADCGLCCGNGTCDSVLGEDCSSCPADCGACPPASGNWSAWGTCGADCQQWSQCIVGGTGGSCSTIGQMRTQSCTGGACTPAPFCGDGECNGSETCGSCADCSPCCGDGRCNTLRGETNGTCPADCPGRCGDSIIQTGLGEQCDNGDGANGTPCNPGSGAGASCTYCSSSCQNVTVQNGAWCAWGPWGPWESGGLGCIGLPCDVETGRHRERTRTCDCPAPANGGAGCTGLPIDIESECYDDVTCPMP